VPIAPSSRNPPRWLANHCNLRHVTPKTLQKALYVGYGQIGRPLQVVCLGWSQFPIPEARLAGYGREQLTVSGAGQRLEGGIKALSFSHARRVLLERFQAWGRGVIGLDNWSRQLLEEVAQHTRPKRSKERPGAVCRVRHRRLKYPPLIGSRAAARMRDQATESL
jgi:hypothetical protein